MSCRGDLFLVVKVIRSGMYMQQSKILQKLRNEKFIPPAKKSQSFFRDVSPHKPAYIAVTPPLIDGCLPIVAW